MTSQRSAVARARSRCGSRSGLACAAAELELERLDLEWLERQADTRVVALDEQRRLIDRSVRLDLLTNLTLEDVDERDPADVLTAVCVRLPPEAATHRVMDAFA